jgi:hypothetical protein
MAFDKLANVPKRFECHNLRKILADAKRAGGAVLTTIAYEYRLTSRWMPCAKIAGEDGIL